MPSKLLAWYVVVLFATPLSGIPGIPGIPGIDTECRRTIAATNPEKIAPGRFATPYSIFKSDSLLPPLPYLLAAVDSFYNKQLTAELTAFDADPKDYWMNFVPSIGIGYTPSGAPRPTLSYSLASVFNLRKQKR